MSSFVTHIVIAKKLLNKLNITDRRKYYLGTSLPDIRKLGNIERDVTHFKEPTIREILEEKDDHKKGVLLHLLLDKKRFGYYKRNNIFSLFPSEDFHIKDNLSKLVEDMILYKKVDNWIEISEYLLDTNNYTDWEITDEDIKKWNEIIRAYINQGKGINLYAIKPLGYDEQRIGRINKIATELIKDTRIVRRVENFYKEIEKILAK